MDWQRAGRQESPAALPMQGILICRSAAEGNAVQRVTHAIQRLISQPFVNNDLYINLHSNIIVFYI
jgi:hypothetical protein